MFANNYSALQEDEYDDEEKVVVHRLDDHHKTWTRLGPILIVTLIVSVLFNLFTLYRWIHMSQPTEARTRIAQLAWDVPSMVNYTSRFNSPDRAVEDAAWDSELVRPEVFAVALDDSYTEKQGLLHSMRWPWDDSKGVYVLNSGHELHCLHMLRDAVNDGHDRVNPRWTRPHLMHCVEFLLQNVMCYADDTPLYTGFLHASVNDVKPTAGLGTPRMCRDWNKLQAWAKERSACYDPHYKQHDPTVAEMEKYKFCPDDRKPWENAQI